MVTIEDLISQYTSADDCLPEAIQDRVAQVREAWSKGNYRGHFERLGRVEKVLRGPFWSKS